MLELQEYSPNVKGTGLGSLFEILIAQLFVLVIYILLTAIARSKISRVRASLMLIEFSFFYFLFREFGSFRLSTFYHAFGITNQTDHAFSW